MQDHIQKTIADLRNQAGFIEDMIKYLEANGNLEPTVVPLDRTQLPHEPKFKPASEASAQDEPQKAKRPYRRRNAPQEGAEGMSSKEQIKEAIDGFEDREFTYAELKAQVSDLSDSSVRSFLFRAVKAEILHTGEHSDGKKTWRKSPQ